MTGHCAHWRTPVEVAGGTVHCSGLLARPEAATFEPERAVFLDGAWGALGFSADGVSIVEWPDFGVIAPAELSGLADGVIEALAAGPVDIGCLGGHGRTGTLLATVIGRAEGLPAEAAIREARQRYCSHAVETHAQAMLVAAALGD